MTDSKHTNDNNSLFTRIQVKSPCADERYSAGNSFARLMTRIHADAVNKARPERNYTKAYRIWLAAASLMIVFLTSGWLATALRPAPEMLIRNNAWEKVENLTLADGTQLTLNRGAQLIYPEKFAGRTREIFLSGEAYFAVAHDKKHPFIVRAGDLKIKVLGTKFNLKSYAEDSEVEVTLVEGSVEMETKLGGDDRIVRLRPGELVKLDKRTGSTETFDVPTDSYRPVVCGGGLIFMDKRFDEIVAYLEKRFDVKINVADRALAERRFIASFVNGESLDEMLASFNADEAMRIRREGRIVNITKR